MRIDLAPVHRLAPITLICAADFSDSHNKGITTNRTFHPPIDDKQCPLSARPAKGLPSVPAPYINAIPHLSW